MLSFTACNSEDDTTPTENERFESEFVGTDKMEIIKDTKTNLTWVNDNRGCFAAIIIPENQCADLEFAGKDDWRTPTSMELVELLTAIAERDLKLNYINSSCAVMSSNESIWVFTENSSTPGVTTTNQPGNAGLRCVR